MNQPLRTRHALRFAGLLAIVLLGLISIIGTGGGGGSSSHKNGDLTTFYRDADGDGFGDPAATMEAASQPQGYVVDHTDCNDNNDNIYPGALEACGDGLDNDCDGQVDEGCQPGCALVPDTGQTLCYGTNGGVLYRCPREGDLFFGQDGCYTINPPSFTKLDEDGDELVRSASKWAMVRDNVTGLIWEVKKEDGSIHEWSDLYDWYDANDVFIAQLNAEEFGGYTDWRLPTKKELIYAMNYGLVSPAIDTDYFSEKTVWSYYWSSTSSVPYPGHAWCAFVKNGTAVTIDKTTPYYVRAVRGGQNYFSLRDNGDGTVTDNYSGLMWMKTTADTNADGVVDEDDKVTWAAALDWCETAAMAGYDDWRLPTIKEMESIVDDNAVGDNGIDINFFPNTMPSNYWSSTTRVESPDYAWHVTYTGLKYGYSLKASFTYYVRAVRGGE